jgi:RNA polymerase subunit RPABC4/transcription elongation factor Spt4
MIQDATIDYLQSTKGMVAEGGPTQGGWFVQAKEEGDGWKSISGMKKAIQVQILEAGENAVVNCGFGKWSDKVGAGAIGMFVFAPLAVTAIIGAAAQKKLPNEIFDHIEKFILSGGVSAVAGGGRRISGDEVVCPECKKTNEKGTKFCKNCGGALGIKCAGCGTRMELNTKFCPECGASSAPPTKTCAGCSAELAADAKFCAECGAKGE